MMLPLPGRPLPCRSDDGGGSRDGGTREKVAGRSRRRRSARS